MRISGDDSLEGRMFIAFLAVALHKMVENKLRKAELLNTMTVNKAMDLARKFKVVQFADAAKVNLEVPLKAREVFEAIAPRAAAGTWGRTRRSCQESEGKNVVIPKQ